MPRPAKRPRLYLDPKRKQWVIRDRKAFIRTGIAEANVAEADKALSEYLGAKHKPEPSPSPSIAEVLAAFLKERVPHMRSARNARYNIGSLERWWGEKRVSDINARTCREYASARTPSAARVDLIKLRSAVKYWHQEYGPLDQQPNFWLPPQEAPRERWLSRSEAASLLWSAMRVSYLKRMILLGLYTGSRPGVIKELEWSWIDFEAGVMRRRAPGEAERANKRRPNVRLGARILAHLRRWKRIDAGKVKWIVNYHGRKLADPHDSWRKAVKRAGLKGVTPHTLRHTRATWLMQSGVDLWEAAGHLGMSVQTLERTYGHHHTDFQKKAAEV